MQARQPPAPDNGPGKVQQTMNLKELRDVYVPVQLFNNRKTSALLDTGCDTSNPR